MEASRAQIGELDIVALKRPLASEGLPSGATGTVVYVDPGGRGYLVEFTDGQGETLSVEPVEPDDVELVTPYAVSRTAVESPVLKPHYRVALPSLYLGLITGNGTPPDTLATVKRKLQAIASEALTDVFGTPLRAEAVVSGSINARVMPAMEAYKTVLDAELLAGTTWQPAPERPALLAPAFRKVQAAFSLIVNRLSVGELSSDVPVTEVRYSEDFGLLHEIDKTLAEYRAGSMTDSHCQDRLVATLLKINESPERDMLVKHLAVYVDRLYTAYGMVFPWNALTECADKRAAS